MEYPAQNQDTFRIQPTWIIISVFLIIAGGLTVIKQLTTPANKSVIVLSSSQFSSATSGDQLAFSGDTSTSRQLSLSNCKSTITNGSPTLNCPDLTTGPQVAGEQISFEAPTKSPAPKPKLDSFDIFRNTLANLLGWLTR